MKQIKIFFISYGFSGYEPSETLVNDFIRELQENGSKFELKYVSQHNSFNIIVEYEEKED